MDKGGYDKMTFVPITSATRFDLLEDHSIDILCEATTVSLDRIKRFRPTLYTFLSGASFMYKHPAGASVKEKILKIGVLKNTTTRENILKSIWPNLNRDLVSLGFKYHTFDLVEVDTHWKSKALFDSGEIDIYIADREILIAIRKLKFGRDLVVSNRYYTIEPYALFTRNDDLELLDIANTTLRDMYRETDRRLNIQVFLRTNFPGQIFSDTLLHLFKLQRILD
jgi:ABC-type amino acid transport substrate-binding protein